MWTKLRSVSSECNIDAATHNRPNSHPSLLSLSLGRVTEEISRAVTQSQAREALTVTGGFGSGFLFDIEPLRQNLKFTWQAVGLFSASQKTYSKEHTASDLVSETCKLDHSLQ